MSRRNVVNAKSTLQIAPIRYMDATPTSPPRLLLKTPQNRKHNRWMKNSSTWSAVALFPLLIIYLRVQKILLPKGSWGAHRIDLECVRYLVFFEASVKHDSTSPFVHTSKSVHVKMDLNVDVFDFHKRLETSVVGIEPVVSSLCDLEQTLVFVDAISICSGGPSKCDFPRTNPESAYIDAKGNWRHKMCLLALAKRPYTF